MRPRYKFFVGLMVVSAAPFLAGGLALEYVAVQKAFAGAGLSVLSYMILGMSLCAIGASFPVLAIRSGRNGSRFDQLKEQHPDEPWLWRDDWSKQVLTTGSEFPYGPILIAVLWNASMIGLGLLLYHEWLVETDPFKWSVLALPVIGAVLCIYAGRAWLQWSRFGETRFVLGSLPVPAGDLVEGIAYTNIHPDDAPIHGFKVSLTCLNEKVRIDRMSRSTRSYILWRDESRFLGVNSIDSPSRVVLPLYFRLPEDCTQTSLQTNNRVTWKLKIEAKTEAGDYSSTFTLPVFIDDDNDDRLVDWADCPSQLPASYTPVPVTRVPEEVGKGIEIDATSPEKTVVKLNRSRNRMLAGMVTIVTSIWWAMTGYLFAREASIELSVLCALAGVLATGGALMLLTFDSELLVQRSLLSFRKGPFGRGIRRKINAKDIKSIGVETGSRTGGGYLHNICIECKDGSRFVVADLINDKKIADWIAFKLQAELFGVSHSYPEYARRTGPRDREAVRQFANLNQAISQRITM